MHALSAEATAIHLVTLTSFAPKMQSNFGLCPLMSMWTASALWLLRLMATPLLDFTYLKFNFVHRTACVTLEVQTASKNHLILRSLHGRMPAHDSWIVVPIPMTRPNEVKHPRHTVGLLV